MDGWMEVNSQTFSGFEYSCLAKSTEGLDRPLCACVCVFVGEYVCVKRKQVLVTYVCKNTARAREGGKRRGIRKRRGEVEGR